jgi:peptidyl-tRNA hydrolase, PTH2 family
VFSSVGTALFAAGLSVGIIAGIQFDGYMKKKRIATNSAASASSTTETPTPQNVEEEDSEIEDVADGDLSSVQAGWTEPCKMVHSSHALPFS